MIYYIFCFVLLYNILYFIILYYSYITSHYIILILYDILLTYFILYCFFYYIYIILYYTHIVFYIILYMIWYYIIYIYIYWKVQCIVIRRLITKWRSPRRGKCHRPAQGQRNVTRWALGTTAKRQPWAWFMAEMGVSMGKSPFFMGKLTINGDFP